MSVQMYELKIVATGEVRDADGNLLNVEDVEATVVVDEATAIKIAQQHGAALPADV